MSKRPISIASNGPIMQPSPPEPPEDLTQALKQMLKSPIRTLVPPWSWKAAAFSAILRSATFFVTNIHSGRWQATKAMLVEAVFAIFAGGLIGAISQQLRKAKPLWATALLVWAGLPGLMILAQLAVHRMAGTPHVSGGVVASFCLAAVASAFSWYAMRQGAMLGGIDETTVGHDLKSLPGITLDFFLVVPRLLTKVFVSGEKNV
jgi:hypothetical protein